MSYSLHINDDTGSIDFLSLDIISYAAFLISIDIIFFMNAVLLSPDI